MGVLPSTLSLSTTEAPLGIESMKSVKLLRGAGAVSILAAGAAGASPRRSAKTAIAVAATIARPKAITRGLRDPNGCNGTGDVATGAADFSNGELARLRLVGGASAGTGSVDRSCRDETAVRAEAAPRAFERSLDGSVDAMGRGLGLSWRLVEANVRSAAISSRTL